MKIASLAQEGHELARYCRATPIKHLFLDGIPKISERSVEPARSLEREIYVRQEAKVLSLDGTESEKLVPDHSL
jgi:hypothetical protein